MKGTPDNPRCGFSKGACQILEMHQVPIHHAENVLDNDDVRQGIKDYSDWPTIPQLYIGGEFIGGFDIMLDLHKSGEIMDEFKRIGFKSAIQDAYESNPDKEDEKNDK